MATLISEKTTVAYGGVTMGCCMARSLEARVAEHMAGQRVLLLDKCSQLEYIQNDGPHCEGMGTLVLTDRQLWFAMGCPEKSVSVQVTLYNSSL